MLCVADMLDQLSNVVGCHATNKVQLAPRRQPTVPDLLNRCPAGQPQGNQERSRRCQARGRDGKNGSCCGAGRDSQVRAGRNPRQTRYPYGWAHAGKAAVRRGADRTPTGKGKGCGPGTAVAGCSGKIETLKTIATISTMKRGVIPAFFCSWLMARAFFIFCYRGKYSSIYISTMPNTKDSPQHITSRRLVHGNNHNLLCNKD